MVYIISDIVISTLKVRKSALHTWQFDHASKVMVYAVYTSQALPLSSVSFTINMHFDLLRPLAVIFFARICVDSFIEVVL